MVYTGGMSEGKCGRGNVQGHVRGGNVRGMSRECPEEHVRGKMSRGMSEGECPGEYQRGNAQGECQRENVINGGMSKGNVLGNVGGGISRGMLEGEMFREISEEKMFMGMSYSRCSLRLGRN